MKTYVCVSARLVVAYTHMNRLRPHIGIATIFLIGIFVVSVFGTASIPRIPTTTIQNASSTLAVVNTVATTSAQTPIIPVPKKVIPPAPKPTSEPAPTTPLQATPISAPTSLLPSESASLDASAVTLRAALVNIICYAPAGSGLRSISGSGVIVDPKVLSSPTRISRRISYSQTATFPAPFAPVVRPLIPIRRLSSTFLRHGFKRMRTS